MSNPSNQPNCGTFALGCIAFTLLFLACGGVVFLAFAVPLSFYSVRLPTSQER